MSHPATHFIRALIYEHLTDADIHQELLYKRIIPVPPHILEGIRREVSPILDPDEVRHSRSGVVIQRLRRLGILTYFRHRFQLEFAEKLLYTARIREVTEKLLIASVTPKDVAGVLQKENGFEQITTKDVKLYKHYFWNPDLLSESEMMMYLRDHDGTGLYVEALQSGQEVLLRRMGLTKSDSLDDLHTNAMQHIGLRMKHLEALPFDKDTDARAVSLSSALTRMWKNHKMVGADALQQAYDRLRRFVEDRREPKIATPDERGSLPGIYTHVETDESDE